ncbi:MAG: HAMP domain-containing sensor histidine kinase [Clostridiaceae bacterium]|nr:HAMP domain-containing sensor histidine kinase [Clostridiaceae bacterium]
MKKMSRLNSARGINSLRFKIFAGFTILAFVLLTILNTYPISLMRNQIIFAREAEMRSNFGAFSSALESSPILDYETAATALSILDIGRDYRVLVTDGGGRVVYDNLKSSDIIGKTVLFPEIIEALFGKDVFRCRYDSDAFSYRIACSVTKDAGIVGSVYAYEYDTESAGLLGETQNDIARISFTVTALAAFFIITFTTSLRRRFDKVLEGVNQIREGNYDYRIELKNRDELGTIAEEFNQMSAQLGKNESIRRQFVSDASHELKTPLASIKLLCDSILQAKDIKVEEVREFLGDISDEIDRLTRITEGLLYLSRMENGDRLSGICDLTHTVIKCADRLKFNAKGFDVNIIYNLPETAYVSGNPDMIYQVVFNLMENSIKYNRQGGTVHVTMEASENNTVLHVADTGIGIKEDELERIFDRFYRVDKMRSRQTGGTGLGLSIVGQCMDAIGGHVEVTSTFGEGTCFTVYFKNAPAEKTDEGGAQ